MSEGLDRHMDDTLLRATMAEARAEMDRGAEVVRELESDRENPAVPVLHQEDLDEALEGSQGERVERVRAIATGEPVDPPHRIRRVRPGDDDGFVGMGPGVDYESEARDF